MTRPPFEVADIVRRHGDRFLETHRAWLTSQHRRVLRALVQCRTAALGGHRDRCEQCAQPALSYNSCRDRHCPKCLTAARNHVGRGAGAGTPARRLRARRLHDAGGPRAPRARRTSVSCTTSSSAPPRPRCSQVAANPTRLGAAIGGLMVLHTWGQRLQHHPHIHCVVPAGGLVIRWRAVGPRAPAFFLPIPVLRQVFRGKLVAGLREAFAQGRLHFPGALAAARHGGRLSRVSPVALSPGLGGLCEAALWQSPPTCCTISRGTRTASRSQITGSSP